MQEPTEGPLQSLQQGTWQPTEGQLQTSPATWQQTEVQLQTSLATQQSTDGQLQSSPATLQPAEGQLQNSQLTVELQMPPSKSVGLPSKVKRVKCSICQVVLNTKKSQKTYEMKAHHS